MSDLPQRYALAAIEACASVEATETLARELELLAPHLTRTSPLSQQLTAPVAAGEARTRDAKLLDKLKLSAPAVGLVQVLLKNRRLALFADVASAARIEVDSRAQRRRAYVRSAVALDEAQTQRLEQTLSKRFGTAVVAHVVVDPLLRAGLICRIGSTTIDSSLKSQLRRIARKLG